MDVKEKLKLAKQIEAANQKAIEESKNLKMFVVSFNLRNRYGQESRRFISFYADGIEHALAKAEDNLQKIADIEGLREYRIVSIFEH